MSRTSLCAIALGAALLSGQAFAIPLNNTAFDCQVASQMGRSDPATLRLCNRAVQTEGLTDEQRAATHLNRGVVYIARGSERLAIADFEEAVRLNPALAEAHVNLGLARLATLDYAAAAASLTTGLTLGPREPAKAYYGRGLAYEALSRLPEAREDFQRAASLAPNWADPRNDLARVAAAN